MRLLRDGPGYWKSTQPTSGLLQRKSESGCAESDSNVLHNPGTFLARISKLADAYNVNGTFIETCALRYLPQMDRGQPTQLDALPWRLNRDSRFRLTSGHSFASMLYITLSRTVPSRRAM